MNRKTQPKRRIKVQLPDGRTKRRDGKPIKRNFTKKSLGKVLKANGVEDVKKGVDAMWSGGWRLIVLKLPEIQGGRYG